MRVRSRNGKVHHLKYGETEITIGPKAVTLTEKECRYVMNLIGGELKVMNYGTRTQDTPETRLKPRIIDSTGRRLRDATTE